MINIKADWQNKKIFLQLDHLSSLSSKGIRSAFYQIGNSLQKASTALIDKQPKHGKVYKIKVGGVTVLHTASAPEEAPASITYNLRKSIGYELQGAESLTFGSKKTTGLSLIGKGGFSVNYPKYLEEGTTKAAARPYLKPAIVENYRNIEFFFANEIKNSLVKK